MRVQAPSGLVVAALTGLLLAGCGDDSSTQKHEPAPLPGVPATVRVVDPGDGDAAALAYEFREGRPAHWTYRSDLDITVDGVMADYPAFTVDFTTRVLSVDDGQAEVRVRIDDIDVAPGTLQSDLAGFLAAAKGIKGTYTVRANGSLVASTLRLPRSLNPAVKIPLAPFADGSVLFTPLPTDPVSPGASWVAANSLDLAPSTAIDQSITYSLGADDEASSPSSPIDLEARVNQYVEYRVEDGPGTGTTRGRLQVHADLVDLRQRTVSGTLVTRTEPADGSEGPPFTIRNRVSVAVAP